MTVISLMRMMMLMSQKFRSASWQPRQARVLQSYWLIPYSMDEEDLLEWLVTCSAGGGSLSIRII